MRACVDSVLVVRALCRRDVRRELKRVKMVSQEMAGRQTMSMKRTTSALLVLFFFFVSHLETAQSKGGGGGTSGSAGGGGAKAGGTAAGLCTCACDCSMCACVRVSVCTGDAAKKHCGRCRFR